MKVFSLLTILGALALPVIVNAATITESVIAPTGSTISQPDSSGTPNGGRDNTGNTGTPSQSFTVGATGFTLAALTVKGDAGIGGFTASTVFVLSIRTRNAGDTASTGLLAREVSQAFTPASGTSYLTFTLATPVALSANSVYAFDIYTSDSTNTTVQGTGSSSYTLDISSTNVYSGGQAFQNGYQSQDQRFSENPGRTDTVQALDRTFYLNSAVAVPEPSAIAFGIAVSVVAISAIRRRLSSAV